MSEGTRPAPPDTPGWYPTNRGTSYWNGKEWDTKTRAPRDAMIVGVTPAGWYPHGVNGQTYWNGRAWTDQHAPLPPAKNPAAVTSLVLALVAFGVAFIAGLPGVLLAIVLLLLALLFGLDGYSRARKNGGVGRGAATAGIVLAILPVIVLVLTRIN